MYFTGGTAQSIIHALQRMIHPDSGDPVPTIISISYGWGPDAASADSFSEAEYTQIGALFQDAANLAVTVLSSKKTYHFDGRKLGGKAGDPVGGFCLFDRNGETYDVFFNGFQVLQKP